MNDRLTSPGKLSITVEKKVFWLFSNLLSGSETFPVCCEVNVGFSYSDLQSCGC